jgi:hypothetical protein
MNHPSLCKSSPSTSFYNKIVLTLAHPLAGPVSWMGLKNGSGLSLILSVRPIHLHWASGKLAMGCWKSIREKYNFEFESVRNHKSLSAMDGWVKLPQPATETTKYIQEKSCEQKIPSTSSGKSFSREPYTISICLGFQLLEAIACLPSSPRVHANNHLRSLYFHQKGPPLRQCNSVESLVL